MNIKKYFNTKKIVTTLLMTGLCLGTIITAHSIAFPSNNLTELKGMATSYPWTFTGGTQTSRITAIRTGSEIASKAGYSVIPVDMATNAWNSYQGSKKSPSAFVLRKFGKALHASVVIYGSVAWHTRSIWVGLGPKTISTATVNVHVFDVYSESVVYNSTATGRSDERENDYKIAADILVSPLVTAVSGGPATPQEQKAVQIALGRAYHKWVRGN